MTPTHQASRCQGAAQVDVLVRLVFRHGKALQAGRPRWDELMAIGKEASVAGD